MKRAPINRGRYYLKRSALERTPWTPKDLSNVSAKPVRSSLRRRGPSPEETAWRLQVLAGDVYICRLCHEPGTIETLVGHHIAERSLRPDLVLTLENGCALHWACHTWIHENLDKAEELGLISLRSRELAAKEGTLGIR